MPDLEEIVSVVQNALEEADRMGKFRVMALTAHMWDNDHKLAKIGLTLTNGDRFWMLLEKK